MRKNENKGYHIYCEDAHNTKEVYRENKAREHVLECGDGRHNNIKGMNL